MKYSINKTNFNDFSVYEINKLEGRGYSIPYSSLEILKKTPFKKERISSDIVKVLSGKWQFRYYKSTKDLPDIFDTDKAAFDTVKIPSTWQRTGYDAPAYINCPYAFDDKPPYVPNEQPVAAPEKKGQERNNKQHPQNKKEDRPQRERENRNRNHNRNNRQNGAPNNRQRDNKEPQKEKQLPPANE